MHEIGHNLGHHHSGKDGVTYADPTCNMGNRGSWSDAGTNFCFNAAKTWANKWYETYHATVDPSSGTYDGTLVGINAVKDGTIAAEGQDVVLKIASSGATTLYVMFNRQAGANNEVPSYGDQVVITEQGAELVTTSSWMAALSDGQTYTKSNWSSSGKTLTVKVCYLEVGTPGSARILVYATGQETLTCEDNITPAPTVVQASQPPTSSPISKPPTESPVSKPPTESPVSKPPTESPVSKSPTSSPVTKPPTESPVTKPTSGSPVSKTPTSSPVTKPPTESPVTKPPTESPVSPDTSNCQDSSNRFLYKNRKNVNCKFIGKKKTAIRCRDPAAAENCPVTCNAGCTCIDSDFKLRGRSRTCQWVARRPEKCNKNIVRSNCPLICGVCGE